MPRVKSAARGRERDGDGRHGLWDGYQAGSGRAPGGWYGPISLPGICRGTSGADESGEQGLQLQLGFLQLRPGARAGYHADAGVYRGVVVVYVS